MINRGKGIHLGPEFLAHREWLMQNWKQGEHVLVTGGTGSGKSVLAKQLYDVRLARGGHVIVFYCKLRDDKTFLDEYQGWTIWNEFKRNARTRDRRIILKVDSKGLTPRETLEKQREVFRDALDNIADVGNWTVGYDEGYYFVERDFLNMSSDMAMQLILGRAAGVTNVVLSQRPAYLPLVVYGSATYAYTAMTKETTDRQRLAQMSARESSPELFQRIAQLEEHEFLWTPARATVSSQVVNVAR